MTYLNDSRWKQRFDNFEKAKNKMLKFHQLYVPDSKNEAYQLALIQSFEFTYELGWKMIKDYLKENGLNPLLPREVLKEGFAYGVIDDGQTWIDMLEDRNLMSHSYDEKKASLAINHITQHYISSIEQVYRYFYDRK